MAVLSPASTVQSSRRFGDADQSLIFFDWDDTLFPTSDFIDRRRCLDRPLSEDERREIGPWQNAVRQLLEEALHVSDRVVILTNSTRPWVEACIDDFAPELRPMFRAPDGPILVYAGEALKKWRASEAAARRSGCCCLSGPTAWWETSNAPGGDEDCDDEQLERESTAKKRAGMEQETAAFYSRYEGQSWKNVLSFGDMRYEHDAAHGLRPSGCSPCFAGFSKKTTRGRLRTKTVLVPLEPSLSELTVALHVQRLLLPLYVAHDGSLDIDLQANANPIEAARIALRDDRLRCVCCPTAAPYEAEASCDCEAELARYNDLFCKLRNVLQPSD